MRTTNPIATAALKTTTRWAAVAIFLVAGCGADDLTESQLIDQADAEANADRVTCTTWPGVTDCASVCDPTPTGSQPPNAPMCDSSAITTVRGIVGYCSVRFSPTRVDWTACGVH